jgi:c-di-GMP-binding flagellar brake protein YcgR
MERRLYPRIPIKISAMVTTDEGLRIKVIAVDVSSDGLNVECNTNQRNMITPGGCFIRDGRQVSVSVDLDLSEGDSLSSKIVAKCNVVFSRRMSSELCKIGLRYVDMEKYVQEQLAQFMEERWRLSSANSQS